MHPVSSTSTSVPVSGQASELSPTPSESLSAVSVASFGNASALSPTPSESESSHSVESFGNASLGSVCPSPSVSTTVVVLSLFPVWSVSYTHLTLPTKA